MVTLLTMIPLIPNDGLLEVIIIGRNQSGSLGVISEQSQWLIREALGDDQISLFPVWQTLAILIPTFESDSEDGHLNRPNVHRKGVASADETTTDVCPARSVLYEDVFDRILYKGVQFRAHRRTSAKNRSKVLKTMGLFDDDTGLL